MAITEGYVLSQHCLLVLLQPELVGKLITLELKTVSGEALSMTIPFAGFFCYDPHSQVCSEAHLSHKLPAGGKVSLHQVSLQISAYRLFLQICHLHLLLKALRGLSLRKENLFFI